MKIERGIGLVSFACYHFLFIIINILYFKKINNIFDFIDRLQKGASTFLTYPIYLADLPPLTYDYEFEDGFSKILSLFRIKF